MYQIQACLSTELTFDSLYVWIFRTSTRCWVKKYEPFREVGGRGLRSVITSETWVALEIPNSVPSPHLSSPPGQAPLGSFIFVLMAPLDNGAAGKSQKLTTQLWPPSTTTFLNTTSDYSWRYTIILAVHYWSVVCGLTPLLWTPRLTLAFKMKNISVIMFCILSKILCCPHDVQDYSLVTYWYSSRRGPHENALILSHAKPHWNFAVGQANTSA